MYAQTTSVGSSDRVVDLRSDTVTKPCAAMRKAMAEADVGDDVYGEDPTVNRLQAYTADLLGKEAAIFVPSGTMANLIAIMGHCSTERMSEVYAGNDSHIHIYEAGNPSIVGGAYVTQLPTQPDGTIPLQSLQRAFRCSDIHHPKSRLMCLENTHCNTGGRILGDAYLDSVKRFCVKNGMALHCDGARAWHAAVARKLPMAHIAQPFDSISLCFSKGLGAPVGSILAGEKSFIDKALHIRKLLGGGMRQAGVIAAAALFAVQSKYDRLADDHAMAVEMADGLKQLGGFGVPRPETNMVVFDVAPLFAKTPGLRLPEVPDRTAYNKEEEEKEASSGPSDRVDEGDLDGLSASRDEFVTRLEKRGLLVFSNDDTRIRAVPHYGNTMDDIRTALEIIAAVRDDMVKKV